MIYSQGSARQHSGQLVAERRLSGSRGSALVQAGRAIATAENEAIAHVQAALWAKLTMGGSTI